DLINAIGKDLGHGTNTLIGAKLLLRFTYSGTNSSEGFVLRVGTNDIDISNHLQIELPATFVRGFSLVDHFTVRTERFNPKAGTTNSIDYTIMRLLFGTTTGSFNVDGFLKRTSSSLALKRQII